MELLALRALDPSLEILWGEEAGAFKALASREDLLAQADVLPPSLFILGERKYLSGLKDGELIGKKGSPQWGVLFKLSLWEELDSSARELLQQGFDHGLVSPDPVKLLPALTHFFYRREREAMQFEVDGRKLGTAHVHPSAQIAPDVFLGDGVRIGPYCKIHSQVVIQAQCELQEACEIFPQVTLYPKVTMGAHCRIHSGSILGSDGFGYQFHQGEHHKIWHYGGLRLGSHIEVGANVTIDGGTFSPTVIGSGTKIDNLVQIGHNCRIGEHVIICGMVGISGSARLGDYVVVGGKAGIGPGVSIDAQSEIAGNAMVTRSWEGKMKLAGHPARPLREWLQKQAALKRL